MSWAGRRRLIIFFILGAVVAAFFLVVTIATVYDTPTCTDGIQNQDEMGVDCGGACSFLCTANLEPPTVLFTAALTPASGRADIVALVENKNPTAAARDVPYHVDLYGPDQTLIQKISGTLDLPPGAVMPVYLPNVSTGTHSADRAFLEIAPEAPRWFTLPSDPRIVPRVSGIAERGTTVAPRVEATLSNPSTAALEDIKVVVFIYDTRGIVIAASQTVVPSIPPQGSASAVFTWPRPFASPPASIRVVPMVPL